MIQTEKDFRIDFNREEWLMSKSHPQSFNKRTATQKTIDRNRRINLEINKRVLEIEHFTEIVETLKAMKPLYQDLQYKDGWNDCIYLLDRTFRKYKHDKLNNL